MLKIGTIGVNLKGRKSEQRSDARIDRCKLRAQFSILFLCSGNTSKQKRRNALYAWTISKEEMIIACYPVNMSTIKSVLISG